MNGFALTLLHPDLGHFLFSLSALFQLDSHLLGDVINWVDCHMLLHVVRHLAELLGAVDAVQHVLRAYCHGLAA